MKFGKWTLVKRIGSGGNGEVWRVSANSLPDHAIKILKFGDERSFQRFRSEIDALLKLKGVAGIIPLVDFDFPDKGIGSKPWFVMPIATEFSRYMKSLTPERLVSDFIDLSKTLAYLHSQGISHRDIKPANILFLNQRLCFSDFGLVKYPSKLDITEVREDVGPKFTMAPEMRRNASDADGSMADVYSFVKTLWIGLTNRQMGFDGQYNSSSILGLKNFIKEHYTTSLDVLMFECTDNEPRKRPEISEVTRRLGEWLALINDFHNQNLVEWTEVQRVLFPISVPKRAVWTDIDSISAALLEVVKVKSLNHMFYPEGGGNTITGVSRAKESGMIALHVGERVVDILKPKKLSFESFGHDQAWNYFRLEAESIQPTGVYKSGSSSAISEELTELYPGKYVSFSHWQNDEYKGESLPDSARPITRYLSGSFVFFSTRSYYNLEPSTYDGRHNRMDEEEFRSYIAKHAIK